MSLSLPKIIGHRGIKGLAPENTVNSIIKAIDLKIKWIEIDVKISKDKIPILLHDDLLDRTTSGTGKPIDWLYKEILKLDAGNWFAKKYSGSHVPTLKEVLLLCSKKNIGVNIELKPNKGFEKENVESVVNLINNLNFNCPIYFSSFDIFSCIKIKKLLPNFHVGILIDKFDSITFLNKTIKECKKNNFFSCGISNVYITKKIIETLKKNQIITNVYSAKNININEANKLWSIGINSIFVDNIVGYEDQLI
tara:strand:+ start:651 stop:1403 length:753 start_codon:yes stop_codon:yes gene_type:complete